MADEKQAASSVTISFGDPKVWALIAALAGGQFAASKLSISGVENKQEKAVETAAKAVERQESIDDKLDRLTRSQGEMSYRLERVERAQQELKETVDKKGGK